MNKAKVVDLITQAQQSVAMIPAGRVDRVRGAIAFQAEIVAWRGLFAQFVRCLQADDEHGAAKLIEEMRTIALSL